MKYVLEPGITGEAYFDRANLSWDLIFYKDADKRQFREAFDALRVIVPEETMPQFSEEDKSHFPDIETMLLVWVWGRAKARGILLQFGYGRKIGEFVKIFAYLEAE